MSNPEKENGRACQLYIKSVFPAETDEVHDVLKALKDCRADWKGIGMALHIKVGKLEEIERAHPSDPNNCLTATIIEWLKKNYKTEKFGDPSWRILVKAVADFNKDVARKIAQAHQGRPVNVTV